MPRMIRKRLAAVTLAGCMVPVAPLWAQTVQGNTYVPANSQLQVELAKANVYLQSGRLDEAEAIIDQLKKQYPNNAKVLETESDLYLLDGNRGAAFADLNQASRLEPNNEEIATRQRAALLDQGTFAGVGYQLRLTNEADEQVTHAAGQAALSPSLSAQINVEDDHIRSRTEFMTVNGESRNFDQDHQRGNITLGKVFQSGDEGSASVYAANHSAGAGAQYSLWDRYGATTLEGNFQKPYWDYPETVALDATKDNIRLERKQIFTNHFVVVADGGFNHYNLRDDHGAAEAAAWDLNATYTHPYSFTDKPGNDITLGLTYRVNAEYFTHMQRMLDATGSFFFKPFPTNSYEVHSALVSVSKDLTKDVFAEGFGGYAMNRLGGDGPIFGASLVYSLTKHVGIEVTGTHMIIGGPNADEKQDVVVANLKWRW